MLSLEDSRLLAQQAATPPPAAVQGVSMLLACCWLDFGKAAQQARALREPLSGADGSPKARDPRRQSGGALGARGHAFTTSLHPALFEQVSLLVSSRVKALGCSLMFEP